MQKDYLKKFFSGDPLAASRLMSVVERGGDDAEAVLNTIFPKVGRSYRVGVTGLTGSGKSSLINKLAQRYRSEDKTVGVVAVDPTSPFSGGALLGDRIRMQEASTDDGVFIRSVASRGSEFGLSSCANELADVLDAFGRDIIFLETIGIGQQEYRVHFSVHTTMVVLVPEAGDDIQSLKSGLMEIGDIFVVNKADRAHAARYADDLKAILELRHIGDGWHPPVVSTVATRGEGVDELHGVVKVHRAFLEEDDRLEDKRREALKNRIAMAAEEKLREIFWGNRYIEEKLHSVFTEVLSGSKSPYQAARELVAPIAFEGAKWHGEEGKGNIDGP